MSIKKTKKEANLHVFRKKAQNQSTQKSKKINEKTKRIANNIPFEFIEHTADVKFIAYGKSFSEALMNAAKATINVMTDVAKIRRKKTKHIEVNSKSRESLTYDFLEKIIFLTDTEGFLTAETDKIKIVKKNGIYNLTTKLMGDIAKNYDVHTCIKAVTYNDMEVNETKKLCTIQVVLDI